MYHLEIEEEMEEELGELIEGISGEEENPTQCAHLSVQAMEGVTSFQTMRVTGYHGKKQLHLLLDSGSTHNFIDANLALKLDCRVDTISPLWVKVADGGQLKCDSLIKNFTWKMQGHLFTADLLLLPLSGSDIVLGVQWFSTLGPILWDFNNLMVEFKHQGKKVRLRGATSKGLKEIQVDKLCKLMQGTGELSMLQVGAPSMNWVPKLQSIQDREEHHPEIAALRTEFKDLFAEPTSLPPARPHFDHRIPLKEGTDAINLRPYRYPTSQKDVIEELVQELIDQGTIRDSNSPFAAPVILVKKKDGGWRMCVDYRALNKATIKDKFPIPVIEELLDELQGTQYFSKIDLKSGYHKIRMHPEDVHKTAFKTHMSHYEYLVMPFGLTNAPSTFQALMNCIFKAFLRKIVLVFFDDILVYSPTWQAHIQQLQLVFEAMRKNFLKANRKKCTFAATQVNYLGHIISQQGVTTEPEKIQAVMDWPIPRTLKQLRGFLGLTGYYRRFVQAYGTICRPLTNLLKKNSFQWSSEAEEAFNKLKLQMVTPPVLALPNFHQPFIIETDASGAGTGAVLMQAGHPIAYSNKALSEKNAQLSAYERELLAIIFAIKKWHHYLILQPFTIRTDQQSLRYLLDHKIATPFQQKWLSKLAGYDYVVEYKQGTTNKVADALSRIPCSELHATMVTSLHSTLLEEIKSHWQEDPNIQQIITDLQQIPTSHPHYQWREGQLRRKGRLVIGDNQHLKNKVLVWLHDSAGGGHSGIQATLKRVQSMFYWAGMKHTVTEYVHNCIVCQKCKYDTSAYPGLLQPLPIPEGVWEEITMDFIEGLPKSRGKEVILVVIDRLSKYAHFIALSHPFSALQVAQAFLDHVYKLHGFPKSIISDRDKIFISSFWKEFMRLQGVQHLLSTAYHPQTDGQSEVLNRCVETYLRCMSSEEPQDWAKWLPLAKFWYNTTFHTAIQKTPFEILYNQPPPIYRPYLTEASSVEAVDRSLQQKQLMIQLLKEHLARAQNRMKQTADKHRTDREFNIGDWVYLKLQPYRQFSVTARPNQKLAAKYYGPYQILKKVGQVAYTLHLPPTAKIHPTFYISQLKKHIGPPPITTTTLPDIFDQTTQKYPIALIDKRTVKQHNNAVVQWLIHWSNAGPECATWENAQDIEEQFPTFDPWGQGSTQGGSIDMIINISANEKTPGGDKEREKNLDQGENTVTEKG